MAPNSKRYLSTRVGFALDGVGILHAQRRVIRIVVDVRDGGHGKNSIGLASGRHGGALYRVSSRCLLRESLSLSLCRARSVPLSLASDVRERVTSDAVLSRASNF